MGLADCCLPDCCIVCEKNGAKKLNKKRRAWDFFDNAHTFLVSVEGVLLEDGEAISGSVECIQDIVATGKRVFYVENTNTKTCEALMEELQAFEFPVKEKSRVVSSSMIAANYLQNEKFKDKVYIIGESEVIGAELDKVGIRHVSTDESLDGYDLQSVLDSEIDPEIRCVLIGYDAEFDFTKIVRASTYLKNPWCLYLSTTDRPRKSKMASKVVYPDVGALTAPISNITRRTPFIAGMPSYSMYRWLMRNLEIKAPKTAVIGCDIDSDILFARNVGMKSLMLLSGGATKKEFKPVRKAKPSAVPNYYCRYLGELGSFLF